MISRKGGRVKRVSIGDNVLSVSAFCLGTASFGSEISGRALDALVGCYRDAGGNFFDTAHCYSFWLPGGAGASERALGDYVRRHKCRDEVVIATKGGHPAAPGYRDDEAFLSPERVRADVAESLQRLGVDAIDLYWLHRDDPRIDVGAIVDMLADEVRRGRIRAFGGSNWTSQRLAEANRYAGKRRTPGFVASEPRWNLLYSNPVSETDRIQPGAVLEVNERDRSWYARTQMPVVPFSPTGVGFFATMGARPESLRTPENLARVARVEKLADELGTSPNRIALAWLLHQPCPVVPILGTTSSEHLLDALGALNVTLSREQCGDLENTGMR